MENKRKQEQEDRELERIVAIFNAKDLPDFNVGRKFNGGSVSGGTGYWSFHHGKVKIDLLGDATSCLKFQFTLNTIKKIKNLDVNEL